MKYLAVLICFAVAANALIQCPPDACKGIVCSLDQQECLEQGGAVKSKGSMCGCCDICMTQLKEGDSCMQSFLLGVPKTAVCGDGLKCNPKTTTCEKKNCAERKLDFEGGPSNRVGRPKLNCDENGDFAPKQCLGSKCTCVNKKGENIDGFMVNIWEAQDMKCDCARAQYEYALTGMRGKTFNCDAKGNYSAIQCLGSRCFCTDQSGNKLEGVKDVGIWERDRLNC